MMCAFAIIFDELMHSFSFLLQSLTVGTITGAVAVAIVITFNILTIFFTLKIIQTE